MSRRSLRPINRFLSFLLTVLLFSSSLGAARHSLRSSAATLPEGAETVLRVCDDVEQPVSLNPYQIFSEKTLTLLQQILEGLVRFDPQARLEPALAERWERMNDTAVRFYLRKGISFHNGEPLNAQSVKFSLEKYVNPETRYPGFGFMSTISHANVIDDHTVDVITHAPDGLLLNRLAAFGHILPPEYYQKAGDVGFAEHPVGTGPFKFDRWEKTKQISLVANRNYWMKNFPRVDRLVFKFVPWENQVEDLLNGRLDIVTELPGTATSRIAKNKNFKVEKVPTFYVVSASFNLNKSPLSSRLVRQAMNLAVDREDIVRYDLLGNGRVLATVTMPGEEGHNETLKPYPFDPEMAKRLLKQAGYSDGFRLKVVCKYQGERAFRIIAKQLQRIGIEMDVTFFSDAESTAVMPDASLDMLFGGCPDPMAHSFFIQSIFLYSKCPYAVGKNPAYDQLLEKMIATIDAKKRESLAQELDQMIYDDFLMLPAYQRIKTIGYHKSVTLQPHITGMPHLFSVRKEMASAQSIATKN